MSEKTTSYEQMMFADYPDMENAVKLLENVQIASKWES